MENARLGKGQRSQESMGLNELIVRRSIRVAKRRWPAKIGGMLLPQYSLRQILAITALLGVVSLVTVQAINGAPWAFGVLFGLVALVFVLGLYGLAYAVAMLWGSLPVYRERKPPPAAKTGKIAGCILAAISIAASCRVAEAVSGFQITLPSWPIKQSPTGPIVIGVPTPPGQTPLVGIPTAPPTTPPANTSGLLLTLDSTWADCYGYRPIRITVKPVAPTGADRMLQVVLKPGWNYRSPDLLVSQDIELPAGFTSVTKTIAVPQLGPSQQQLSMDVFEDGVLVRELSLDMQSFGMGGSQFSGDNASPAVLSLGTNINDNSHICGHQPQQPASVEGGRTAIPVVGKYLHARPSAASGHLFANRLDSSLGRFAGSVDRLQRTGRDLCVGVELEALKNQHDKKWQAIRRWVTTGGNLWVYGIDDANSPNQPQLMKPGQETKPKWARLEALNELIDFDEVAKPLSDDEKDKVRAGWRVPDPTLADAPAPQIQYWGGPMTTYSNSGGSMPQPPQSFDPATGQPIVPEARFLLRELGHGMVVAISDQNPTTVNDFRWNWLYSSVGTNRFHWVVRHGVSFQTPNDNYWYFLIPGVGAAPVGVFQLLITLFVVAIGPINYYLLKRWHKQNLILITVPISAAVVTLALVSYAIAADGFSVRMQSRSITYLDQDSGEAACLGRLTYYAGLTPAEGLKFSASTAVYPLEESPSARSAIRGQPSRSNGPLARGTNLIHSYSVQTGCNRECRISL